MKDTCKAMLGSVLFLAGASVSMTGAAQSMSVETLLAAAPESSRSIVGDPIQIVARRLPAYPVDARIDGVEGRVLLRYTVQTDGTVGAIETLDSQPPFVFTRGARSAVAQWRFAALAQPIQRTVQFRYVLVD